MGRLKRETRDRIEETAFNLAVLGSCAALILLPFMAVEIESVQAENDELRRDKLKLEEQKRVILDAGEALLSLSDESDPAQARALLSKHKPSAELRPLFQAIVRYRRGLDDYAAVERAWGELKSSLEESASE